MGGDFGFFIVTTVVVDCFAEAFDVFLDVLGADDEDAGAGAVFIGVAFDGGFEGGDGSFVVFEGEFAPADPEVGFGGAFGGGEFLEEIAEVPDHSGVVFGVFSAKDGGLLEGELDLGGFGVFLYEEIEVFDGAAVVVEVFVGEGALGEGLGGVFGVGLGFEVFGEGAGGGGGHAAIGLGEACVVEGGGAEVFGDVFGADFCVDGGGAFVFAAFEEELGFEEEGVVYFVAFGIAFALFFYEVIDEAGEAGVAEVVEADEFIEGGVCSFGAVGVVLFDDEVDIDGFGVASFESIAIGDHEEHGGALVVGDGVFGGVGVDAGDVCVAFGSVVVVDEAVSCEGLPFFAAGALEGLFEAGVGFFCFAV